MPGHKARSRSARRAGTLCDNAFGRSVLALAAALALANCSERSEGSPSEPAVGSAPGNVADNEPFADIAPDQEVRFTGTEPFWGGKVRGGSLTYSTPDDIEGDTIAVQRFAGRGGVSWSGTWQGSPFRLAVSEGKCSDGMSDRTYPYVATLRVAGEQRNGCAWTARRSFKEAPVPPAAEAEAAAVAAQELVVAEWRKAANRAQCAPAGFATTVKGTARRANFSGGWAIAWDRPGLRSAFGVAGTGSLPEDAADAPTHRGRLAAQWPLFRELPALPQPAFAGYGVEGAGAYPADNPDGKGINSLAYVRIGGQSCDYNVWSRLGRAHLERLLDSLRLVSVD
jgi:uncharacterized membrane protein